MDKNKVQKIETEYKSRLKEIENLDQLEDLRKEILGSEGSLSLILKSLSDLKKEERKEIGKEANRLKQQFLKDLEDKEREIKRAAFEKQEKEEDIDVSLPGKKVAQGQLHPLTQFLSKLKDAFRRLGFEIVKSPQVDTEYYNFDALNIPADHPARTMWDTFWLPEGYKHSDPRNSEGNDSRLLLRTHTSSGQVRYMEKNNPPFRIILPGRCYRYEKPDATHGFQLYQVEGLMVGKDITITDFKGVMEQLFQALYGVSETRMRPGYFPFVEPGFELDLPCPKGCSQEKKKGDFSADEFRCSLCEDKGWVEIMGAGMVHPHVFKAAGYNPDEWQGFAFGIGLDRLAMIAYDIPDLRLLYNGKVLNMSQKL